MITGSVTNRYAEALFELARAKGVIDDVARDVEFLAAEVSQETVAGFLFDGRIPLEQKSERLQLLQPHVHALTFNFVRLLIDKRRLDVLRHMGAAFRRRMLLERGATEGVVESARPLGDTEVQSLEDALGQLLHKDVKLSARLEPELIGGVRVVVDNRMLDQSLRGRLDGLREDLSNARLDAGSPAD